MREEFKDIYKQLTNYQAFNKQEERDIEVFLQYLENFENCFLRDNIHGHFCSSSFVLNKQRDKLLMIYHKIYQSWGWLGGHADGDTDLEHVARKEVEEESGVAGLELLVDGFFTIDTLPVLGHLKKGAYVPAHVHLSCAYLFEADEDSELLLNEDETEGVAWKDLGQIVSASTEPHMQAVYSKGIEKMKRLNII